MRVLLDTNVLAAGIVGNRLNWTTPPTQIWRRWQAKQFALLISAHVMKELNKTLDLPWFAARIALLDRELAMREILAFAEVIELATMVSGVASHPADDLVLSAAVSGNADYLVTGDAKFLQVGEYRGVKLRTPTEFLRELDAPAR